jgi:hypothetical protein
MNKQERDAYKTTVIESRERLSYEDFTLDSDRALTLIDRIERLEVALRRVTEYKAFNGDTWPADVAREALGDEQE